MPQLLAPHRALATVREHEILGVDRPRSVQLDNTVGEDLQRDVAAQLRVGRLIDLPHAAFADEARDVVVAETGADVEGHQLILRVGARGAG